MSKQIFIKVYHGFGHKHDIMVFGHVFEDKISNTKPYTRSRWKNLGRLLKLFMVNPLPQIPLQLKWAEQKVETISEFDGFFRIELVAESQTDAGWHKVKVESSPADTRHQGSGEGEVFIPHITQYGFISDIDDTIMVSHSATIWKRMKELLFKNPLDRDIFAGVAEHYRLLSGAHTDLKSPNPFFYVSSSEWNLYDYLRDVFHHKGLPKGAFLLNQVKRWYELTKTGKTKHEGKLLRILRVLKVFPNQKFILFGDNSQSDPFIYATLLEKYADRVHAIYIRNVNKKKEAATRLALKTAAERGVHTCLFSHSNEAIDHSREIGLIK